ncbi:MAG: hypothetical protein IT266_09870 [Saprospiraceae bacterium]|nr:hypothetical protein [Saprospiraceae bacterium]
MSTIDQKTSRTPQLALAVGCTLFLFGFWGYAANDFVLHTGLTPMLSGLIFALAARYLGKHPRKNERYLIAFAMLLAIALVWPLLRNVEQADPWGIFRTSSEIAACLGFAVIAGLQKPENSAVK